jgi:hypothetical protein
MTIGEVGTFRSAALATRWVNSSRRNLLRRGQQESSRVLSDSSSIHSKIMPLKSSAREPIPEEFDGATTTEKYTTEGIVAALKGVVVLGKVVSVFLLLIPLAFLSHYQQWSVTWIGYFG